MRNSLRKLVANLKMLEFDAVFSANIVQNDKYIAEHSILILWLLSTFFLCATFVFTATRFCFAVIFVDMKNFLAVSDMFLKQ